MPKLLPKPLLRGHHALWFCLFLFQFLTAALPAKAQVNVLTQRYDNAHSGCNLAEQTLNPSTVSPKRFGKLFSREVDGKIYAQPLVVSGLTLPKSGKRNVVFVATQHNSVYAFDADDPDADKPFWRVNLGHPVSTQDVGSACGVYSDISHEVGITGTPVIDAKTHTLYLVSRTKDLKASPAKLPASPAPSTDPTQPQVPLAQSTEPASPPPSQTTQADATQPVDPASPLINDSKGFHQYLHALDLVTGKERPHSPVEIRASVPGRGIGSVKGVLAFNPRIQNQRAALLLNQGVVTICWAGHCDTGAYHGWMMGYNAQTLQQTTVFCTTPNGQGAGIWQSGGGPSVDEKGDIYIVTGNGTVDTDKTLKRHTEYGASVLRLQVRQGRLQVADSFTPYNYTSLNDSDLDTGSTSVMMLPGSNLVAAGSKAGVLYVLDKDHLGGFNAFSDEQIVQKLSLSQGFIYSTPVVWNRPGRPPLLYSWGMDDRLKAFEMRAEGLAPRPSGAPSSPLAVGTATGATTRAVTFNPFPVSQSSQAIAAPRPGGMLSLSSNGDAPGSGVLWALQPTGDANTSLAPGILRAFDANDLNRELWNSSLNEGRDSVGLFAKFCPPVVANGKVYVASFSNQLCVYGLNPRPQAAAPVILSRTKTVKDFVTLDCDDPRAVIRYTLDGSTPTSRAPLYKTPFLVQGVELIQARAFVKGQLPSTVAATVITDPRPDAPGSGLVGTYFTSADLSGEPLLRLDDSVDNNSRPTGISPDRWSARWTGEVQAPVTGTYTFTTNTDDGARLWVKDRLLIDDWNVHGAKENSATIDLQAGQRYPLVMEYFQGGLGFAYQLMWTPPGQSQTIIPRSALHAGLDSGLTSIRPGLIGDYYRGITLDGPSTRRFDAGVDNNPRPDGIPLEQWSARWTGQVQAPATGTYSFITNSDDGVRLWVNDQLLIDNWVPHSPTQDTATIPLQKGQSYSLVMEYFQGYAGSAYQLMWAPPGQGKSLIPQSQLNAQAAPDAIGTGQGLAGSYFSGVDLGGTGLQRVDAQVDNNPPPAGIGPNQWSARWTGELQATRTGTYILSTLSDDGVRLSLSGQKLIDDWTPHPPKEDTVQIQLERGQKYPISIEYFQGFAGATYQLMWTPPAATKTLIPQSQLYAETDPDVVGTGDGLLGSYFKGTDLKGGSLRRVDAQVDNQSNPRPQIVPETQWSARWTGQVQATRTGNYTFVTNTDDGARLWVGGQMLINGWNVHGATENKASIHLEKGRKYSIVMEYFQGESGFAYQLMWVPPGQARILIPQSQLYSSAGGIGAGIGQVPPATGNSPLSTQSGDRRSSGGQNQQEPNAGLDEGDPQNQ